MESEKYIALVDDCVAMLITTPELAEKFSGHKLGLCIADNPRALFFSLHNYLSDKPGYARGVWPSTFGEGCDISPLSSIAKNNVKIGNNVIVEEFVVIRPNTIIEDNTIIRAGCVIGGKGFHYVDLENDTMNINDIGGIIIQSNVEIQYNCSISRAVYPWDDTVIGDYCKISDSVSIAHDGKIGAHTKCAQGAIFGGRVTVGDNCWVGLGATVRNGIKIGNGARINMGAVVTKDVAPGESVTGNFAIQHEKFINNMKLYTSASIDCNFKSLDSERMEQ